MIDEGGEIPLLFSGFDNLDLVQILTHNGVNGRGVVWNKSTLQHL